MKNSSTGLICICLLLVGACVPGRAQDLKADPQPAAQALPASDAATADQTPAPQTPATPTTPPQDPNAPASPAQTPQPPAEQPATTRGRIPEPPPPPVRVPDIRRPGESGYFVGLGAWFPTQHPSFDRGKGATFTGASYVKFDGKPKYAENIEIGFAAGLHNTVKLEYNDFHANGNLTAPTALVLWAKVYDAGTYLSDNYHVQSGKLSFEYLTWPFPVGSRKFRLKTLWQAQYTQVNSIFDAPNNYYDSTGAPKVDSAGNLVNLSATRAKRIISPMFGLSGTYYPSRHFRLEFGGSGFGLPHRASIWNADASLNIRVTGHIEVRLGAKAFSFKTSPKDEYYLKGTVAGAFFGLRWYSNSE